MVYIDKKYKFFEYFNNENGRMVRSGIIKDKKDTGIDPFMRSFPSLLDIGIMGTCKNKKYCTVGCYQGDNEMENMSLDNFKSIIDQAKNKTMQVALGGLGSPNEHPDFVEIIKYAKENGIIPSYTTSGIELTDEQIEATKSSAGAVAVSFYKTKYSDDATKRFLEAGIKTNIHYVLGNDSIDEAILRLRTNAFPEGINAVIFLLYKPVGCVKQNNVLQYNDPRVSEFFKLIDEEHPFKVGLDACSVPGVLNFSKKVDKISITPCDGSRFSAYITPDNYMLPCSFDTTTRNYAVNLNDFSMKEAWESDTFEKFRSIHRNSCIGCSDKADCHGGCPIAKDITLCQRGEKNHANPQNTKSNSCSKKE